MLTQNDGQEEKRAARRRLESELIILQSDQKKFERQHESAVLEVKQLETELRKIETALQEKRAFLRKIERDMSMNDAEVIHLKKRINIM